MFFIKGTDGDGNVYERPLTSEVIGVTVWADGAEIVALQLADGRLFLPDTKSSWKTNTETELTDK